MSLLAIFNSSGPSGFGYGSTAEQVTAGLSLAGKTILVTGCNSGIGQEACRVLALRGALVLGTARTQEKAAAACARFPGGAIGYACELAEPTSVQGCIEAIQAEGHRLDAIICNAGIMMLPKLEKSHGYELQFFTNHIGHFMLVTGLLKQLKDDGRVVMLSSVGHTRAPASGIDFENLSGDKGYNPLTAYGQSKMANLLFAKELQRRFAGTKKTAYAVHPGPVSTNLARSTGPILSRVLGAIGVLFFKSVAEGAATEIFAAVSPKALPLAGSYLADSNVKKPRADADDAALAARLWAKSEEIVVSTLSPGAAHAPMSDGPIRTLSTPASIRSRRAFQSA
jgi:NAD(P)-dependent dehydrogenase (short-subunit alcohol dehydrogenase family)